MRKTVFRSPINDPIIRNGVAELVRIIDEEFWDDIQTLDYNDVEVTIEDDETDELFKLMYDIIFNQSMSNVHRKTKIALELDENHNDGNFIPERTEAYPDGDTTRYDSDEITKTDIESTPIPIDQIDKEIDGNEGLYRLSETFIGNVGEFGKELKKSKYAFCIAWASLNNDIDFEKYTATCSCCGRSDMPTRLTKSEGDLPDIEKYNTRCNDDVMLNFSQKMTPYMNKTGRARPAHLFTGESWTGGRCPLCVFSGFYYSLMKKVVSRHSRNEVRILSPVAPLSDLVAIRSSLEQQFKSLTQDNTVQMETLDFSRSDSEKIKTLYMLEELQKGFKKVGEDLTSSPEDIRASILTYMTTTKKGGNPGVRGFSSFSKIDPDEKMSQVSQQIEFTTTDGEQKQTYPISSYLEPFVSIYNPAKPEQNIGYEYKETLGDGILNDDLEKVENGMFNLFNLYRDNDDLETSISKNFNSNGFNQFIAKAMSETNSLTDQELESLKKVGRSIGEHFHEKIGVLLKLKNTRTHREFLEALEQISTRLLKTSSDENDEDSYQPYAPNRDEIDDLITIANHPEKWETARHLLITHASFSGHYQNVVQSN